MALVTVFRTASSSQLGALLSQSSASATYLTKVSASTTYLTQASASTTYLTQISASTNYLTQASASTNYLTQSSASTIYLTQSSASTNYLTQNSASTNYLTQASASTNYALKTNPVFPNDIQVDGQINLLLNQSSPSTYINGFTVNGGEFLRVQSGGAIDLDAKSITLAATSAGIGISGTISHSSGNFNTSGNISVNGRITSTSVPAFSVYALNLSTQTGNLTYNVAIHNNGNHMVLNTGLFTAPVAGYYYFSYHGFVDINLSGNTTVTFQKNGSQIPSRIYNDENGASYGPGISLSVVTYLAANDNVRVNITGAGMHGNDNSFFKGFLIG